MSYLLVGDKIRFLRHSASASMLGLRNYFGSPKAQSTPVLATHTANEQAKQDSDSESSAPSESSTPSLDPAAVPLPNSDSQSPSIVPYTPEPATPSKSPARRFSFRTFSFQEQKDLTTPPKHEHEHKPMISTAEEHRKEQQAAAALAKHLHKSMSSRSEKRAHESALAVRALIVGPSPRAAAPKVSGVLAKPQLSKIKSQLMNPKYANRIILKLKDLPPTEDNDNPDPVSHRGVSGPIHAVCLDHPDHEIDDVHFSKLKKTSAPYSAERAIPSLPSFNMSDIADNSVDQISQVFSDLKVVDLVTAPDLGIGQPGDGEGLFSGAVPTAETVINGIKQITPEIMALGFAAGKAIWPDHTGIYPPKDRISVFTYWWGLELALPPPTLGYLAKVESISNAIVNFLTALSLVHNGVREIIPFVRYIAQFIEFEYGAIKKMDHGDGVVCAATWLMPAAMIPRPWDFPEPPPKAEKSGDPKTDPDDQALTSQAPKQTEGAPASPLPTLVEDPSDQVTAIKISSTPQ